MKHPVWIVFPVGLFVLDLVDSSEAAGNEYFNSEVSAGTIIN